MSRRNTSRPIPTTLAHRCTSSGKPQGSTNPLVDQAGPQVPLKPWSRASADPGPAVSAFAFALIYGGGAFWPESESSPVTNVLLWLGFCRDRRGRGRRHGSVRLYDIDRLISRTVAYALLSGILAIAFFGVTATVGAQVSDQPLFVAAGPLVAATAFNPLRKRVQSVVDRRFNRSRYDADAVIEFGDSLRVRAHPDGVVEGWVRMVSETLQPAAIGVW